MRQHTSASILKFFKPAVKPVDAVKPVTGAVAGPSFKSSMSMWSPRPKCVVVIQIQSIVESLNWRITQQRVRLAWFRQHDINRRRSAT